MKEVKTYDNVRDILIGVRPIIERSDSANFINDDLSLELIVESKLYYSRVINNKFYFQVGREDNLNTILGNRVVTKTGLWGLISAVPVGEDRFYIYHQDRQDPPVFLILDAELNVIKESVAHCHYASGGLLFQCYGDTVKCFDGESGNVKWEIRQESILEQNSIVFDQGRMFFTLKSGPLKCLDVATGDIKWTEKGEARIVFFENGIYAVGYPALKVIDADDGRVLREESMQEVIDSYSFHATGQHKVYDQYIFSMASGRPGMVAIYDRKSLKFQEILTLDEMIPNDKKHLYWFGGRLYILDYGKTLHVYED